MRNYDLTPLYRSAIGFDRLAQLAEHAKVIGADLENGLLDIDLEREIPEALKPRKIAINQGKIVDTDS